MDNIDINNLIDEKQLKAFQFCFNCSGKIFLKNSFHLIMGENLFIYQNNDPNNNDKCNNPTLKEFKKMIIDDDEVLEYETLDNMFICEECIEKLRPYLVYNDDIKSVYVILPSYIKLDDIFTL